MMGNRGTESGDEYEAFSRGLRGKLRWRRGAIRRIKRAFTKRIRKAAAQAGVREAADS